MAEKARFTGRVQHTEETIRLLFKTQYNTYEQLRMIVQMGAGMAMAVAAFLVPMNRVLQVLLAMLGCWLLVSKDFPASLRAEQALEQRKGVLPENVCKFFDKAMELNGEGRMRLEYSRFQRLIEDGGYLYLFLGRNSVCMIDKETVEGGSAEDLKAFVEKRTGMTWSKNRSLLWMNLTDIRQALKDRGRS